MEITQVQDNTTTKPNKSMFWKAGMVIASYYVAIVPTTIFLGVIWLAIFMKSGQTLAEIQNTSGSISSYLYIFILMIMGLFGIRYGVHHVAKKSIFTEGDVYKVIVWFIVVSLILLTYGLTRGAEISYYPFVTLVINCLAIFWFSKKSPKN